MFHITCFGWLLFRASGLHQAGAFAAHIFTRFHYDPASLSLLATLLIWTAYFCLFEFWIMNAEDPRTRPFWNRGLGPVASAILMASIILFTASSGREFIYFQF